MDTLKSFTRFLVLLSMQFVAAQALVAQTIYPKGMTIWDVEKSELGLTFINSADGTHRLVNPIGQVVNQWGDERPLTFAEPIFDNTGHVLAIGNPIAVEGYPRPRGSILLQYDVNGDLFFEFEKAVPSRGGEFGGYHHDAERLDDGNTLILCSTVVDVPAISPKPLIDDCIIEINFGSDIVWEWHTHEHYDELGLTDEAKALISEAGGDWGHANAIAVIPPNEHTDPAFAAGNIIISYRSLNAIVIIDKLSGSIVWKAGPTNNLTIGQHNAQMIPPTFPGSGNIIAFDNGLAGGYPPVSRAFSRIVEIDPTTNTIVWQYNASFSGLAVWSFFSPIISSVQRLSNGNTVITEGTRGRIFEVTQSGEIVWEFMSPYFDVDPGPGGIDVINYGIYRSWRMPVSWGWPAP